VVVVVGAAAVVVVLLTVVVVVLPVVVVVLPTVVVVVLVVVVWAVPDEAYEVARTREAPVANVAIDVMIATRCHRSGGCFPVFLPIFTLSPLWFSALGRPPAHHTGLPPLCPKVCPLSVMPSEGRGSRHP
jgi:hypothetical protein